MTQGDVMNYLGKVKKPKSAHQIAEKLGISKCTANNNLKRLLMQGVIFVAGQDVSPENSQYNIRLFKVKV